jgi:hypothetical protein
MTKRNKYIYWVATLWLALGMVSTAVVQLLHMKAEVEKTSLNLGYPIYMLTILGVWKLLGVLAVLLPKLALLKEWAYAGFFFIMTGAIISHLAVGEGAKEIFGPALLLMLTVISWNFRPADRKLIFSTSK